MAGDCKLVVDEFPGMFATEGVNFKGLGWETGGIGAGPGFVKRSGP